MVAVSGGSGGAGLMELMLIRHALPMPAADSRDPGDPGLGEEGRRQAELVAMRLAEMGPWDALYCSPQARALETAAPIAQRAGLDVTVRDGLAEFDWGKADYIHFEELAKPGNTMMAKFAREDFSDYGTTAEEIRAKAIDAVEQIVAHHAGGRVMVVTHGTVVNGFVGGFLGARKLVFHHPHYTGLTLVQASRKGHREVVCLNESAHLRLLQTATVNGE
ncbi:histidine phosphatase family protein [Gordonia jinghuaiqii]|uniref:Histidine phosphatase family protein n=1 Tax=Gordonia jinghuaiqii TaxID=2758710 RepID=A0A7D7QZ08_9ACTN|nr:histidine phosphatase family protein [Gordonia jinghuaiqii]QMT02628.1 histidine phosphatase family protein [Gordonia jinghuaiqii]